jgi:hypothetical protein
MEPLRIFVRNEHENPMTYIVANSLHLRGIEPDLQEISAFLSDEQFIAGESVVYILGKELSIRTIGLFNPQAFLARGHYHWREISQKSWTPEQEKVDDIVTWTSEKRAYWEAKVQRWVEANHAAGVRKQHEDRCPGIEDIAAAIQGGAMAIVTLRPNYFTQVSALVYGQYGDEYGTFMVYCPEWGEDCLQSIPRHDLQPLCSWDGAGIVVIG